MGLRVPFALVAVWYVLFYCPIKFTIQYKSRRNIQNATAKLVMRHLHKFHRIYHFKVRNLLEIERETIKCYEYFGK